MVHLRAFSFTDDSANEVLANGQNSHHLSSNSNQELEQVFLRPLDPAIQLFQLRQMQSFAYQKIFQSSREKLKEPWQTVISYLNEMFLWAEQIPMVIRKPTKKLFRSELLYASILVLSPDILTGALKSYGIALAFVYANEYADIMSSINWDSENFAFYTSHDVLRASFVAKRFIKILQEETFQLLDEGMPEVLTTVRGFTPTPPSLPNWGIKKILNQAILCLERLEKVIKSLGLKYDYPESIREFQIISKDVKKKIVFRQNTIL